LLHCSIKRRPQKALASPISLFFRAWLFGIQINGTNSRAAKPDHWCLSWYHMRTWCHVSWARLTYPWREMTKPLEGRAVTAHAGCCVFCVCVLFCVCLRNYSWYIFLFLANQLVEIDRDKVQIRKLCASVNKKPPWKHPYIIRCASVEWFIQVAQNLTLARELYCGVGKNCAKIVLRRARFS
jgi:hypothetical protein